MAERLPPWARWSAAAAEQPWTIGVEEEVVLLERRRLSPANRIDELLGALPEGLRDHVSAETHACVAELRTSVHPGVAALEHELAQLRSGLEDAALERLGLRIAASGTHPLATHADVRVSRGARYREIEDTTRALTHREPTMALHVHVAVPDGPSAVRALDGIRADLPALLAVSGNSPFWRGADSGFASMRTPLFSMFPRVGVPRHFGTWATYVRVVERMLHAGAVPEPGFLWWDVRLRPRLGTVEVRIMDAQTSVRDVVALAALVQCLVRRHAEASRTRTTDPEVLDENRFLAARDGMGAELVDAFADRRRPVRDVLAQLVEVSRPFAAALGCAAQLADVARLADDPGCARQRRVAARGGAGVVPAWLSGEFAPRPALQRPRPAAPRRRAVAAAV